MPRRFVIDPAEWEDIASDMGLAIHYWCRSLTVAEHEALAAVNLPDMYTIRAMAEDPVKDGELLLIMTKRDYEWALGQIEFAVPGTAVSAYVASAFADRDKRTNFIESSYLDGEVADVVAQLHLFGEVPFG
jgi:hypothetical protein